MRLDEGVTWSELGFESKDQSPPTIGDWVTKVLSKLTVADNIRNAGIRKAWECSKSLAIVSNHSDMELLVSR